MKKVAIFRTHQQTNFMKKSIQWAMAASMVAIVLISFSFRATETKNFADKKSEMIKEWERAKAYTKEYLDAATEEAYSFKPTPEMRTFGQQMLHLTDGNYGLVSAACGKTSPYGRGELEKSALKTKAEITKATLDGYDYVIAAVKEMDDAKFATNVKLMNFEMPAEVLLAKVFEHQTHHRGQTTVYLRLSGLTPPQEKLF
jgi:uncharacterized damage-inducible protein DinB